jgi:hypothetical protein
MGTRGLIKLIYNGQNLTLFNRFDSYPSGLGVLILKSISELLKEWNQAEFEAFINRIMKQCHDIRLYDTKNEYKSLATKVVNSALYVDPDQESGVQDSGVGAVIDQATQFMQKAINNIMIEYTYTLNFDEHTLTVEGCLCAGEYWLEEYSIEELISFFEDERYNNEE